MGKGSVIINGDFCLGCGYCVEFCKKKSLTMSEDDYTSQGFLQANFSEPESCNACGLCVLMCPHFAIEVYKVI
ncbi:MAG: ferredoxin family protein [Thermodesulfobacteriota bacterium]|nr:ferredoxin family protein [Thermodesulfobacteriota bacterium]